MGIVLVFGLPGTVNEYNGSLLIKEYLNKYPYAVPIRSKTAIETAEKRFHYISMLRAPKEVLSDQGKELLKKVVYELSKICGIERKVTAPYHSRTNGFLEIFNQILVNALNDSTWSFERLTLRYKFKISNSKDIINGFYWIY